MPIFRTVALLSVSNLFMTTAWYGHLKFKSAPMWAAILISWGIALFEYMFQVPANRLGYGAMTAYQLKILQECISLLIFIGFAAVTLGEGMNLRYGISFLLVLAAVGVAFYQPGG